MSDEIVDPDRCKTIVQERVAESELLPVGYFNNVANGSKASTVSHSDPDNLSMQPPSGNYGITASDIDRMLLVDIDDHKDGYDADALEYAREHLPDTLTFRSAHNGEGRLYLVPRDDQGRLPGERLDDEFDAANVSAVSWGEIRVEGQYIVGAGSQLDADGCTKDSCTSCAEPDGGRYTIQHDRPIAELDPDTLVDILDADRNLDATDDNDDRVDGDGTTRNIDEYDEPVGADSGDSDAAPAGDDPDASSGDSGTSDTTPYDAIERLDAEDVAAETIVASWNDDHSSGDNVRAFYPAWDPGCNGTANVVGRNGWNDTGGLGKGGPIEMAAIASDETDVDETVQPGEVAGEDWVTAYQYLKDDCGFDLPELSKTALRKVDEIETESDAAMALDALLGLYEGDNDRDMEHWSEIFEAVGALDPDTVEEYADRVEEVTNVPADRVVEHARLIDHEDEYGRIVVDDGRTWYLAGTPRRRYELLNFELDVQSLLSVERGPIRAELRAELDTGDEFQTAVEPGVFEKKERFDEEILSESFGAKFDPPEVNGSTPYVQDLLNALKMWVHHQPAPRRTGVKHMGLHDGDEFAIPDGTLTADGWTDDPDHVYLESETGAERRVSLANDDDTDLDDVATILETVGHTRDPERFLPVLGWFYAAPLRPMIESFSESGEFNHLSVTGDTGSGKTATLSYLWRMFGMAGEPFSVDSSSFAQLATFSSTNSIPLWFDEYKPSDIRDYKIDAFHDLYRKATRGAFAERGNPDQTTTSYKIQAPVCVSGEQQIQGPAERRRSIMTQFRKETTDAGTETATEFKSLVGQAQIDDGEIQIGAGTPDPEAHALAFYKFACDIDSDELQELWYDALERAHTRLDQMGVVDALDDLELQGIQTVLFGYEIMHRFAARVGADRDELPDRDQLDDAIAYVVDRIGPEGKRKSHADRFVELFGRAAAATDPEGGYVERGTHYEIVKEGEEGEELRINLPRTYDALSKYAADHGIDRSDMLNSHLDYRDRFEELAEDPGTYVTTTMQYTAGVSNCTGMRMTMLVDVLEFDREVLETDLIAPKEIRKDADDDDHDSDLDSAFDADPKPIEEIEETEIVASTVATVDMQKHDGYNASDRGPRFTATLTDETGEAELVVWDDDQMPRIIDGGSIGPDALQVRNAQPQDYDGTLQLVVTDETEVTPAQAGAGATETPDAGPNQQIDDAATDGGTGETTNEQIDSRIVELVDELSGRTAAKRHLVEQTTAETLETDPDRVAGRIDKLLERGDLLTDDTGIRRT